MGADGSWNTEFPYTVIVANAWMDQLNSTQLNEHLWTQVLKHFNVHIYLDRCPPVTFQQ